MTSAAVPTHAEVRLRARGENFSVATYALGRSAREDLLAIYTFARYVDEVGDTAPGDRDALLDECERRLAEGDPTDPIFGRLARTIETRNLPLEPFERLIAANRLDQVKHEYDTFDELVAYCRLSANPVGELVLHVFGAATPDRVRRSDAVCTALQLVEHWQDVAEDAARGRIYLPRDDMRLFGVAPADLHGRSTGPRVRRLLAFEAERAARLLAEGGPLIRSLRGRARLAVAGYVGGGKAALAALAHADYDVLAAVPRASRAARARATIAALGGRA